MSLCCNVCKNQKLFDDESKKKLLNRKKEKSTKKKEEKPKPPESPSIEFIILPHFYNTEGIEAP